MSEMSDSSFKIGVKSAALLSMGGMLTRIANNYDQKWNEQKSMLSNTKVI